MLRPCQYFRYHGNGEVIRREEFAQRKQAAEELQLARLNTKAKRLASAGKKFDGYPILQVLIVAHLGFLSQKLPDATMYSSVCKKRTCNACKPDKLASMPLLTFHIA